MSDEQLDDLAAQQRARIQGSRSDLTAANHSPKAGPSKAEDMRNALKWARNMGYPKPAKPWPCLVTVVGILCLFPFVVPGLVVLGCCWWADEKSKKQRNALLTKWIDAGRPNPDC